jgi:gamma-glutamyltranspeptidase/glutathione hydrolase
LFGGPVNDAHGQAVEFSAVRGDRASGWLPQSRSEVLARNGMVATSQPLAAQAGLQILKSGGNAIDAAVATAAVMNVVEPGSAGIGGDVFVIAWLAKENKLVALNGSGKAPSGATPRHLAERGAGKQMPQHGIDSATVPGAVDAWDVLLKRAGTRTFKELLQPAVDLAEQGFALSERIRNDWMDGAEILQKPTWSTASRRRPTPCFATPTWRTRFEFCRRKAVTPSIMARSHRPFSPNPACWAEASRPRTWPTRMRTG